MNLQRPCNWLTHLNFRLIMAQPSLVLPPHFCQCSSLHELYHINKSSPIKVHTKGQNQRLPGWMVAEKKCKLVNTKKGKQKPKKKSKEPVKQKKRRKKEISINRTKVGRMTFSVWLKCLPPLAPCAMHSMPCAGLSGSRWGAHDVCWCSRWV